MHQELTTAKNIVSLGLIAERKGETASSEQALQEVKEICAEWSKKLLELDTYATELERDIGMRKYAEISPWRNGYNDRLIGLQPQQSQMLYLRGWEIANRIVQYDLQTD